MGKYVVELVDFKGLRCRVKLSLPFFQNGTGPDNSSWEVLDEGFLKVRSGGCLMVDTTPGNIITNGNLLFLTGQQNYICVNLYSFVGSLGYANDFGTGIAEQPWVVNCDPGHLKWAVVG